MADQEKSPVTYRSFTVLNKGDAWAALGLRGEIEQWFHGTGAEKEATHYAEQRKAFFKAIHPEWFSPQSAGPGSQGQQVGSSTPTLTPPPIPTPPVVGPPIVPAESPAPPAQPPIIITPPPPPPPPPPLPPPPPPPVSPDNFRNVWPSEESKPDEYRVMPKGEWIGGVHWPKDPGPPIDPYDVAEEGTPIRPERIKPKLAPGVEGIGTYDVAPEGTPIRTPPPPPQNPKEALDWKRRLGTAFSQFKQAAPQAAAFGGARGIGRAASTALGAAFPEVSIPAAIGIGIEEKLRDLPRELETFAEKVAASNKELALFSPVIGAAAMRLRFGDFQREMHLAQETGGTAADQLDAVNRMRSAIQPIEILTRDIQNRAGSFAAGAVTGVAEASHLEEIVDTIKEFLDSNKINEEQTGQAIGTAVLKGLIPGIGVGEMISSTFHAIRDHFLTEKQRADEKAEADKKAAEKEARNRMVGPWDAMLFAQSGPGRAFPRLNARRVNPAKEAHDAQFVKEHRPPRH